MPPTVWECLVKVMIAGALGGIVNTILNGEGFAPPKLKGGVLCPGSIGDITVGLFAAAVSWSLYGAGSGIDTLAANPANQNEVIRLTMSALAAAFLIGAGGSKWLTSEINKKVAQSNTGVAASLKTIKPEECVKLGTLTPIVAADYLKNMADLENSEASPLQGSKS